MILMSIYFNLYFNLETTVQSIVVFLLVKLLVGYDKVSYPCVPCFLFGGMWHSGLRYQLLETKVVVPISFGSCAEL